MHTMRLSVEIYLKMITNKKFSVVLASDMRKINYYGDVKLNIKIRSSFDFNVMKENK